MDLGATTAQTFRYVTWPLLSTALVAGGLLAFALSFDEIVVTTFTSGPGIETLPQWIFNNLFRPNQGPIINAVAAALLQQQGWDVIGVTLRLVPCGGSGDRVLLRCQARHQQRGLAIDGACGTCHATGADLDVAKVHAR